MALEDPHGGTDLTPQQEIQKHIKGMLLEKQARIVNRINGSSEFSRLLSEAKTSNRRTSTYFYEHDDDWHEQMQGEALVVDPDGGYYYSGSTLAIVNGHVARSRYDYSNYSDLDFADTGFQIKQIKTPTLLEEGLGLKMGEEGLTAIQLQVFADPTVDAVIPTFYGDMEDVGALLAEMYTLYYLTADGQIKKAINIPIEYYLEEEYLEMEEKLLKSGLGLIAVPHADAKSKATSYYVISEVMPRDLEYMAITLDILDRRTRQNLTESSTA